MSLLALVERLAPYIEKEVNLVIKSKEEAISLQSKLKRIDDGLHEAEREGVTNNAAKEWLKQLQDVAYEMEDVLDEGEMLDLQVKLQAELESSNFLDNARSLLLSFCSCFNQVLGHREVTKKMKALTARIDDLLSPAERGKYNFLSGENSARRKEPEQEASTSLVNKLEVYGRDEVKKSLVEKLTESKESNIVNTQIVSIVGIGGVGKTTLAKLAYNDAELDRIFNLKGWVCALKPFDTSAVAKAILEQFGVSHADAQNLETLVQRIKTAVKDKKFLLVLDNVWTENEERWKDLKNCLDGAKGSKILVTTRYDSVARMMGTTQSQPLSLLSNEDCSQILNGIALKMRSMGECEKLEGIGVKIAEKCYGLPLAARSVGSMLARKSSVEEWETILNSPLWVHNEVSNVFCVLNLSYTDLSPTLKRCFLSSIVAPFKFRDIMPSDMLFRIWMANGYLSSKDSYDNVIFKAKKYFSDLTMRSFFQKVESSRYQEFGIPMILQELFSDAPLESLYEMHDIMYEFAINQLESEYSLITDGFNFHNFPSNSLGKLRTFFATQVPSGEFPLNTLSHLKSVRLLSLRHCNLQLVPEGVGELLHLRYLDLSYNPIKELPETVCNLYNLQTLGIESCKNLSSLPKGFGKLINLRHLLNMGINIEYPQGGFEELTNLWTLSEFKGSKLGCLEKLNQFQGFLSLILSGLEQTEDSVEQICKGKLVDKTHLQQLRLIFGKSEKIDGIVEALQPPPHLQSLLIKSSGKWFSHWAHEESFTNLTQLVFLGDLQTTRLINPPPFAKVVLPALEKLIVGACGFESLNNFLGIGGDASTSSAVRGGGFPKLKSLHFFYCVKWKTWENISEEGVMRCLEELKIIGCHQLKGLPKFLLRQPTSLKILHLSSQKLYHRYNKSGGRDHRQIPNIPKLIVDNVDNTPSFHEIFC